jgi:DNA-binding transcriptional MerR regulator
VSEAGETLAPPRGGKSASAFRTTSEAAAELDLPAHVLRFWETKFPQIQPLKRSGGRRYYRPEDVALLRRIRRFLYQEGYTIRGVQKLLREGGLADGGEAPPGAPETARNEPPLEPPPDARPDLQSTLEEVRGELVAIRSLIERLR